MYLNISISLHTKCNNNNNSNNNNNNNNNLTIEIQRMWNVKTNVMPVTIGATGTISKSLRKYLSNVPAIHEVKELQKTAILGTAHILRKVKSSCPTTCLNRPMADPVG
jgi:hypothetical protein